MLLIPHLLCLLLGLLLAPDTVHTAVAPAQPAAAAAAVAPIQQGTCPEFWYHFNGHCYRYVGSRLSWAEAEKNCVSQDANLVSLHSKEEHDFVRNLITSFDVQRGATWIGLTDHFQEGWWVWTDGSKVSYLAWRHGEPNNYANNGQQCVTTNCGREWYGGTEWCDAECSATHASVCEARPTCPTCP